MAEAATPGRMTARAREQDRHFHACGAGRSGRQVESLGVRHLRLLCATAVFGTAVGIVAAPAVAEEPAPTLSIRTTLNGTPTAIPTASGQWRVASPGKSASLQVQGVNPASGRTTVVAVWTSHAFHPGRGIAVQADWTVGQEGIAAAD